MFHTLPVKDKMKKLKKIHTKKHIDSMRLLIKNGVPFMKSHRITKRLIGK